MENTIKPHDKAAETMTLHGLIRIFGTGLLVAADAKRKEDSEQAVVWREGMLVETNTAKNE